MKIAEERRNFGAVIEGIQTEEFVNPENARAVVDALNRFGVVIIRPAILSPEQFVAFARLFGPLAGGPITREDGTFVITNIEPDGKLWAKENLRRLTISGNEFWHSDHSATKVRALYSMLHAEIVPPTGSETEFADMRAAYAALPESLKDRVKNLKGTHSVIHSRKLVGFTQWTAEELRMYGNAIIRPLVGSHPNTGEYCLSLSSHISGIVGLTEAEGASLLSTLREFATNERFVYRHTWMASDLVIWDNVATMHRATPYDDLRYPRRMRSIRIDDTSDFPDSVVA